MFNSLAIAFKQAETAQSCAKPAQSNVKTLAVHKDAPIASPKPRATKATRITKEAQFTAVSIAAFGYAQSHRSVVEAIAAAGGVQEEVQRRFHIGYIAYRLNLNAAAVTDDMLHVAAVALSSMNMKPLGKGVKQTPAQSAEPCVRKGKRVRSGDEQRAYDASRTAWSTILKLADIKSSSSRGGARKPRPGSTKDKAQKPDVREASPGFTNYPALHEFMAMMSKTLLNTCNKNAKIVTPQLSSAVSDFVAAVKACAPAE